MWHGGEGESVVVVGMSGARGVEGEEGKAWVPPTSVSKENSAS